MLPWLQGDGRDTADSKPEAGPYWSLMFEVSESHLKAVNNEVEGFAGGRWAGVVRECVQGALNTRLIEKDTEIVSLYHRCVCLLVPFVLRTFTAGLQTCVRDCSGNTCSHLIMSMRHSALHSGPHVLN